MRKKESHGSRGYCKLPVITKEKLQSFNRTGKLLSSPPGHHGLFTFPRMSGFVRQLKHRAESK